MKMAGYRKILRDNLDFLQVNYTVNNERLSGVEIHAKPKKRLINAMCKCFIEFRRGYVWFCFNMDFLRKLKLTNVSDEADDGTDRMVKLEDTEYVDAIMRDVCKKYGATVSEFYKCLCVFAERSSI